MAGKKLSAKSASAKGGRRFHGAKGAKAAKTKGKSAHEAAVEAYIAPVSRCAIPNGAGWR